MIRKQYFRPQKSSAYIFPFMTMKHLPLNPRFLFLFVIGGLSTCLFSACEKEMTDEVAIRKNRQANADITVTPQSDIELSENNGKSKILVLDFTGQYCPYCPPIMKGLQKRISETAEGHENIFLVSMHPFYKFSPSFYSYDAEQYAGFFKIRGLPNVVTNYQKIGHFPDFNMLLNQRPQVISGFVLERLDKNSVKATFKGKSLEGAEIAPETRVMFWLIEKELIGSQKDGFNYISNYTHHNVFRATLNGYKGEHYQLGKTFEKNLRVDPTNNGNSWRAINLENCMILGILLDAESKKVLSVSSHDVPSIPTGIRRIRK